MAIARDGSLLFSDDTNGVIYRIAYREARARR
jgi:glucose/arabinose dehydrogenase